MTNKPLQSITAEEIIVGGASCVVAEPGDIVARNISACSNMRAPHIDIGAYEGFWVGQALNGITDLANGTSTTGFSFLTRVAPLFSARGMRFVLETSGTGDYTLSSIAAILLASHNATGNYNANLYGLWAGVRVGDNFQDPYTITKTIAQRVEVLAVETGTLAPPSGRVTEAVGVWITGPPTSPASLIVDNAYHLDFLSQTRSITNRTAYIRMGTISGGGDLSAGIWVNSNTPYDIIVAGTAYDTAIRRGRAGAWTFPGATDLYTTGYLCAGTGCTSSAPVAASEGVYDSGNRVVSSCSAGSGISSCTVTNGVLSVSAASPTELTLEYLTVHKSAMFGTNITLPTQAPRLVTVDYGVSNETERTEWSGDTVRMRRHSRVDGAVSGTPNVLSVQGIHESVTGGGAMRTLHLEASVLVPNAVTVAATTAGTALWTQITPLGAGNIAGIVGERHQGIVMGASEYAGYGPGYSGTITTFYNSAHNLCAASSTTTITNAAMIEISQGSGACSVTDQMYGIYIRSMDPLGATNAAAIRINAQPAGVYDLWLASASSVIVWGTAPNTVTLGRARAGALQLGANEDLFTTGFLCAGTGCTTAAPSASAKGVYDSGMRVVRACTAGSGISSCTVTDGVLTINAAGSSTTSLSYDALTDDGYVLVNGGTYVSGNTGGSVGGNSYFSLPGLEAYAGYLRITVTVDPVTGFIDFSFSNTLACGSFDRFVVFSPQTTYLAGCGADWGAGSCIVRCVATESIPVSTLLRVRFWSIAVPEAPLLKATKKLSAPTFIYTNTNA